MPPAAVALGMQAVVSGSRLVFFEGNDPRDQLAGYDWDQITHQGSSWALTLLPNFSPIECEDPARCRQLATGKIKITGTRALTTARASVAGTT